MRLRKTSLILLVLLTLSCSYVNGFASTPTPVPTATATATPIPDTETPTPTPSPTQTPTPLPTDTPVPTATLSLLDGVYIPPQCQGKAIATVPAATALAQPTLGVGVNPPISKNGQLNVFNQLVAKVQEVYLYPDYNGVDWKAVVAKYKAMINKGLSTEEFYTQMTNLVAELKDEHSSFLSPMEVAAANAALAGVNDYVGIGVISMAVLNRSRVTILETFPDSAASHAGLKPHDSLLAVDGIPVADSTQSYPQRVRGPECSAAVFTVQTPGETPRNITVVRYRVNAPTPILAQMIPTTDGSRIGYIFLPSFFDETIPGQVKKALQDFGELDGLIIDNRMNTGGSSDVVEPIWAYFTSGVLGNFISRTSTRPLEITADPVNNSQTVPLVILIGQGTVSFGEIFTGALQDAGRAKVVGQQSLGHVELLHGYDFPDGSLAWIAQERFDPAVSHANWEKVGIKPDVEAYADWDTFTFETDPSIAAALKLMDHK